MQLAQVRAMHLVQAPIASPPPQAGPLPRTPIGCAAARHLLPESLGAALRAAACEAPRRPFIRMATGEWSYGHLDALADAAAAGLARAGVKPGDTVSLMLPNGIEFIVLWFALARLGATTAPVNTAWRGRMLEDALNLVDSRLLVAHAALRGQWAEALPRLHHVEQVIEVGEAQPEVAAIPLAKPCSPYAELLNTGGPVPETVVGFRELCLLLYTSGTTGRSKAAMISHRFVLAQAHGFIEGLQLRRDDVLYCPYPLFHLDATVMTVAPALLLRGVAAIGERFSVSRYWDEMRALGATVFDFMGATITMLWKQPPSPRDREHRARLGWGVPLPAFAPQFEQRFGCRLVELYGSTEAGGVMYTPLDQPRRMGSCGQPHPRCSVTLVDADGFAVPDGEPGELLVRGNEPGALMEGYYGMAEATLAAQRDQWFHTGDLLRRDAEGFYYFVGRLKDMVRRRGENISAAEVEQVLEAHPQVLEVAVFGVPSELSEEEVMACVVPRPGASVQAEALHAFAARQLARFMQPRYWRIVAALPRTPTDKVEKFQLRAEGLTPDTWDAESTARTMASPPVLPP
jgi:crotonobetaine/carnitine-CoA ligase